MWCPYCLPSMTCMHEWCDIYVPLQPLYAWHHNMVTTIWRTTKNNFVVLLRRSFITSAVCHIRSYRALTVSASRLLSFVGGRFIFSQNSSVLPASLLSDSLSPSPFPASVFSPCVSLLTSLILSFNDREQRPQKPLLAKGTNLTLCNQVNFY